MTTGDRALSGGYALRVAVWRGDDQTVVVSPRPDQMTPAPSTIRECLQDLARRGMRQVVTSALGPPERDAFLAAGFQVRERLHLLSHDLRRWPEASAPVRLRRARTADRAAVLALDRRAFDTFWGMDDAGLSEALDATPISRFRVAMDGGIAGYGVFGRAGDRGYVQRLAVDPDRFRRGIGTRLLADGLRWMRRHHVRQAMVNTQEGNDPALALYLHVGFRLEPTGLTVLTQTLPAEA
jgi:ribosomal protein S18 acetylase RimI-like enzyme